MMISAKSPVFFLEFIEESPGFSIYNISGPDADSTKPEQLIIFSHSDYSIEFSEPLSENHEYLERNRKWLRSILYTAQKTENKNNFKIPFAFPSSDNNKAVPDDALKVYSDGSCNEDGTGGWASVILKPDGDVIEFCGSEKNSTSNRMELMGALRALQKGTELLDEYNKKSIVLFTDSMYVLKGITHRLEVWNINGFITARGSVVTNIDLWAGISGIMERAEVCCEWIESGSNNEHHRKCDFLAGEESRNTSNSVS